VTVTSENIPPVADAGEDQIVSGEDIVVLDGTGAYDPDDGIVLFLWKQLLGPPVVLSDSTAVMPQFTAPAAPVSEPLTFILTVTDEKGLKDSDTCSVSISGGGLPPPEWSGEPVLLDFEALIADSQEDIAIVAPDYGGLDWTLPELPLNANAQGHWRITADSVIFPPHSGGVWIQASADDIRGVDRDYVSEYAQITGLNNRSFAFESAALRTQFTNNPGKDKNGDGIDDRWLDRLDICFRDIDYQEVWYTMVFTDDAWTVLTAEEVPGLDALGRLESISFWGNADKAPVTGDLFGLDDLKLRLY
jgi:hypothetical protein